MSRIYFCILFFCLIWSCEPRKKSDALQKAKQSLKYLGYSWDAWASVLRPKPYNNESEAYRELIRQFDALSPEEQDSLLKNELSLRRTSIDSIDIPDASTAAIVPGEIQFCMAKDDSPRTAKKAFIEYYPIFFEKIKDVTVFLNFYIIKEKDEMTVNQEKLVEQIKVLNEAFKDIKVKFKIKNINTVIKPELYRAHPIEANLGNKIIKELDNSIPIIVNGCKKILGNAPFPWGSEYRTTKDFIFLYEGTLQGNTITLSDGRKRLMEGKTLVHEIGHYLGLYHIFHQLNPDKLNCTDPKYGSCDDIGDRVKDTPKQKICFFESGFCNSKTKKECMSDSPKEDCLPCKTCEDEPVMTDNFMGYNIDSVKKKFTQGQLLRMLTHLYYGDRYYLIADNIKI